MAKNQHITLAGGKDMPSGSPSPIRLKKSNSPSTKRQLNSAYLAQTPQNNAKPLPISNQKESSEKVTLQTPFMSAQSPALNRKTTSTARVQAQLMNRSSKNQRTFSTINNLQTPLIATKTPPLTRQAPAITNTAKWENKCALPIAQTESHDTLSPEAPSQITQLLNLVFSGGGAKGSGYAGVILALIYAHLFDKVNEITGTSAGSILTALVSAGISPKDLINALQRDLSSFKGERNRQIINNEEGKNPLFSYNAKPLLSFLREMIYTSICKRILGTLPLDKPGSEMLPTNELLQARQDPEFEAVYNKIKAVTDFEKACITFHDLEVLSRHFPKTFKKPILIAATLNKGETVVMSSEKTPNLEVAKAAKASSAIPIYFEPVKADLNGDDQITILVDGGVINNTATQYFHDRSAQLLAFVFEDTEKSACMFKALYNERWCEIISNAIKAPNGDKAGPNPLIPLLEAKKLNCALLEKTILDIINRIINDPESESKPAIQKAAKDCIKKFASQYLSNPTFQSDFDKLTVDEKLQYLSIRIGVATMPEFVKENAFVTHFKKYILSWLADFKPDYTLKDADNAVISNLYMGFVFQTILMVPPKGVGTLSFERATKLHEQAIVTSFFDTTDHILNYYVAPKEQDHIEGLYKDILTDFLKQANQIPVDKLTSDEQKMLKGIQASHMNGNSVNSYQYYLKDYFKNEPESSLSLLFTKVSMQKLQGIADQYRPASETSISITPKPLPVTQPCRTQGLFSARNTARKNLLKETLHDNDPISPEAPTITVGGLR